MGLIHEALAKVMAETGVVGKEKKNVSQGYQFRGIDDVVAVVQSICAKHGVVVVPHVVEREREMVATKSGGAMASVRLLVDHHFYAADGSFVTARTLGEAMDSGDKASNKAMSAALKYALTETLLIPTYEADRDTEEASPEMAAKARAAPKPSVKAPATADALTREVGLLSAAIEAARAVADLDALTERLKALPQQERDALRPKFAARKEALTPKPEGKAA